MLMRTSTEIPNFIMRLGFLSAFFVPLLFIDKIYYPSILVCFMTVGTYGFAYSYLPYEMPVYFAMTVIFVIVQKCKCKVSQISPMFLITLMFLLFRNIIDSFDPQNIFYCVAIIGMFCLVIDKEDNHNVQQCLLYTFIIISISLSLLYFLNYDQFVEDYDAKQGLERSGWIDPNYFSCVLGMGGLSAFILLLKDRCRWLMKLLLLFTMIISFITQVILASRGGALAITVSVLILLLFSRIRFTYKIISLGFVICLVIWMYSNGYFQLLEHRIQTDSGGGSGRLDIWEAKMNFFFNHGHLLHWLFGFGYQSGFELAGTEGIGVGFHNDFVAVLCEYGILGLIVFVYWFSYPFFRAIKENKIIILSMLTYLFVVCATLEPISSGALPYFAFYFTILQLSKKEILGISDPNLYGEE